MCAGLSLNVWIKNRALNINMTCYAPVNYFPINFDKRYELIKQSSNTHSCNVYFRKRNDTKL